jgi:hypothetical protein
MSEQALVLASSTDSLAPIEEARRLIARAVVERDADTLTELHRRASAYELYHRRAGAHETASDAGEIKVRAERGLGQIDAEVAPHGVNQEFRVGGTPAPLASVHKDTRAGWRKLGTLPDDEFDARIAEARADENIGVSTFRLLRPGAHVGNNSGEIEWFSPREYAEAAAAVMGAIDLDPASTVEANEVIGAATFFSVEDDGLSQPWKGRVWMNPPYSRPTIDGFCAKLAESYAQGDVTEACVLVNNATETGWFHALAEVAAAICFPRHRVRFWHPGRESWTPLQGQAVLYFGPKVKAFRREFLRFGFTVTP